MRKLNIVFAVFIFVSIFPVLIATIMAWGSVEGLRMYIEANPGYASTINQAFGAGASERLTSNLNLLRYSYWILVWLVVPVLVCSGIFALRKWKGFSDAIVAAALPSSIFIWGIINSAILANLNYAMNDDLVELVDSAGNGSTGILIFIIVPTLGLISTAVFHIIRLKKGKLDVPVSVEKIEESTQANSSSDEDNIELLQKYKQLLNDGVITQEEFDTKKKQLLGL